MNTKMILALVAVALLACCSYCCYTQSNTVDELTTRIDTIEQAVVRNGTNVNTIVGFLNQATKVEGETNTTEETK
jgi:hypothetical protein